MVFELAIVVDYGPDGPPIIPLDPLFLVKAFIPGKKLVFFDPFVWFVLKLNVTHSHDAHFLMPLTLTYS